MQKKFQIAGGFQKKRNAQNRQKNERGKFMKIKRVATLLLVTIILTFLLTVSAFAAPFSDVPDNAYYAEAVEWAVTQGITNGTSEKTFSPNENCTKAQIITFIWRSQGSPIPTISNPFVDISGNEYFSNAAIWAYEQGMVGGQEFLGSVSCTRSMAVDFLWKNDGRAICNPASFTDVSNDAPYANAVAWAVEKAITNGTSSSTFSPDNICTRAQIVTFLKRYDAVKNQCVHEFEESITPATCTLSGVKKQVCTICGYSKEEEIPALGHNFDNGVEETPATYSAPGKTVFTCLRCGETKYETIPQKDISSSKYPESTYMVGTDLPEGEYILISDSMSGYFKISSDPNGRSILANDNFGYVTYVNAVRGTYLELSRCYAIPYTDEITFNPVNNGYVNGTYKVGKDFSAGTYKLTAISGGYYKITKMPQGNIQSNDFFGSGSIYISVKNGEYVELSRVMVEKVG